MADLPSLVAEEAKEVKTPLKTCIQCRNSQEEKAKETEAAVAGTGAAKSTYFIPPFLVG